MKENKILQQ